MSNVLTMKWQSQCSQSFTYAVNKVKHGDTPTFSPATLSSTSPVTVSASQSNDASPGPEGKYTWNTTDLSNDVACEYHFPAGSSGQLIQVTLTPSKDLQISFDGTNYKAGKLEQSWTSTTTTFTVSCYVQDVPATGKH